MNYEIKLFTATPELIAAVHAVDAVSQNAISNHYARLTFQCERAGLVAFGVSWLVASRVLPVISAENERYHPLA